MIIIWGKSVKKRFQGIVADRCFLCQSITTATLESVHHVSHVYYIPLGRGELVQNQNWCHACGGIVVSDPERYDKLLDKRLGKSLSTIEILEQTISRLAEEIKRRGALEHKAENAAPPPDSDPKDDPRLHLTFERLSEIPPGDEHFDELLEGAKAWADLDEPQRRSLVAKAAERHKAAAYQRKVVTHIYWATQRFTPSQWGWGGLLFIAIAAVGCALFVPKAPRGEEGTYTVVVLGLSLAAMLALMIPIHRALHRRFFRRVFIPEGEERGIRPEDSLEELERFRVAYKSGAIQPTPEDAPLRELAKAAPRLREVMAQRPGANDTFDES